MSHASFVARRKRGTAFFTALAVAFSLAVAVADPAAAGGISVSADRWEVDTDTGFVSYELTLIVTGAAGAGQPCQSYCTWRVEAWYLDGGVEKHRGSLAGGPGHMTNNFTLSRTAQPSRLPEITHIRAVLAPNYAGSWATWTSSWVTVSPPYPDGGIDVAVTSWDANVDTGVVDYDVTMRWHGAGQHNGPCVSYCRWSLLAYYRDGTVEKMQGGLTSGAMYSSGVWSETFPLKGSIRAEITHLKATLSPYDAASTADTYTTWKTVHMPYPAGTADAVVRTWSVDPASGVTTYNLTGEWKGAAQVGGPCTSYCRWTIAAYNRGTTDQLVAGLRSETLYASNIWKTDFAASGTFTGTATHVKVTLEPYDASSTNDRYVRWIPVGVPQGADRISLNVAKWRVGDPSGLVEYDVTLGLLGAAGTEGPCTTACAFGLEAWFRDETGSVKRATLYAGACPSGCWSVSKRAAATGIAVGAVTHLRAFVKPSSCADPCPSGTVESWTAVSEYVYKGQNVAAAGVALAPLLTRNPTFFCERFLLRAGTHHLRSTLTDQYIACEVAVGAAGYTIVRVLESIVDASGPASLPDFLVESFPAPDTSVPPVRQDWENETGCEQDIPLSSIEVVAGHIEDRHGYDSLDQESSKWDVNVPWRLLVHPHSLNHKATEQLDYPGRCKRVIRYVADVGFEWVFASLEYRVTDIYTVITKKASGDLVTAFPGRPKGEQE